MDRLFLRHASGRVITIEGNTQIGRGRGERRDPSTWYTDRLKPADFADLALVIDIDGSPYMSRNHAGIRREGASYTIQDLNSLNGTTRNGARIEPGIRYPLAAGDVIGMDEDTFAVGATPEAFAVAKQRESQDVQTTVLEPEWYCGIAGFDQREHAHQTFCTSVARVARELISRGYETEVYGLEPRDIPAGRSRVIESIRLAAILESLTRRGDATDAHAHTFFQYSGHGTEDGLLINDTELLTPRMLFDTVGSIRGKKFLLLDACHAGVFLADKQRVPPQTTILAATRGADGVAFSDDLRETVDAPMTNLSRRLWEVLRDRRRTFDILAERCALEGAFTKQADGVVYVQEPVMNTAPYTVCLKSVWVKRLDRSAVEEVAREQRITSRSTP